MKAKWIHLALLGALALPEIVVAQKEVRTDAMPIKKMGAGVLVMSGPKTEKGPFLGVTGGPVSAALREQLSLKKGIGIVAEKVDSGSPAELAGVKQYDVLEKLDDQWLVNSQQLAVLIRTHASDEQIALTLIRQGQRQIVTARLAEKQVAVFDETTAWGVPGVSVNETRFLPSGSFTFTGPVKMPIDRLIENVSPDPLSMILVDGDHNLTLSVQNGKKRLLALDQKSHETLFDGPINSDEERKLIPPEIAAKLKRLEVRPDFMNVRVTTRPGQGRVGSE